MNWYSKALISLLMSTIIALATVTSARAEWTDDIADILLSVPTDATSADYAALSRRLVQMDVPIGCYDPWLVLVRTNSTMWALTKYGIEAEDTNGMVALAMVVPGMIDEVGDLTYDLVTCG